MQRLVNGEAIEQAIFNCNVSADRIEHLVAAVADFIIPEIEKYLELIEGAGGAIAEPIRYQLAAATTLLGLTLDEAHALHSNLDRVEAELCATALPAIRAV